MGASVIVCWPVQANLPDTLPPGLEIERSKKCLANQDW
jgi:hypothetical protein